MASTTRTPLERIFCKIYNGIKGEKRKNIKNPDDFVKHCITVYNKQKGICAISGIELPIPQGKLNREALCKTSCISVDRIDSAVGYVEGNIQIVHKHINMMKLDHPEDYFLSIIKNVYNTRLTSKENVLQFRYHPDQYCD